MGVHAIHHRKPVIIIPLAAVVIFTDRKAKEFGLINEEKIKCTTVTIKKFCMDIDLLGIPIFDSWHGSFSAALQLVVISR